jgi:hypothetical protein
MKLSTVSHVQALGSSYRQLRIKLDHHLYLMLFVGKGLASCLPRFSVYTLKLSISNVLRYC